MNIFRKSLLITTIIFLINNSKTSAQGQVVTDITGNVIKVQGYTEIQGSPYLINKWLKSSVKFVNGNVINDVAIKYDQVKDEIIFAGKDDNEYYFNDLVREFNVNYINNDINIKAVFRSGFKPFKNFTSNSFYEVLVDGNIKLLKKNAKNISEIKEYNSATTNKIVNENIGYYISQQNEVILLKKNDIKSLIEILDSKKSSVILEYSKANNLNPKKEDDLKKIISYYNTL